MRFGWSRGRVRSRGPHAEVVGPKKGGSQHWKDRLGRCAAKPSPQRHALDGQGDALSQNPKLADI